MVDHVLAVMSVVGAWWLSTGLLLLLHARARWASHIMRVLLGAGLVVGVAGAVWSSGQPTTLGAYVGFCSALMVWACHELSFLTGAVTGPRKGPCPPGLSGVRRFRAAAETLIHHELVLAATVVGLVALSWGSANQVAAASFGVLWLMRVSAKLNLFVGVPHANTEIMPARLRYLVSYFGPARLSPWLPASLGGTLALGALLLPALEPTPMAPTLVGALIALGALEHVFLARPFGDAALWRWALPQATVLPAAGNDGAGQG